MKIDCNTMPPEQARALARHFSELADIQTAVNNTLYIKLTEALASPITAEIADRLLSMINEWAASLNVVTDKTNAEVRRILGIDSSNSTLP